MRALQAKFGYRQVILDFSNDQSVGKRDKTNLAIETELIIELLCSHTGL
jgi:hypothetical protein